MNWQDYGITSSQTRAEVLKIFLVSITLVICWSNWKVSMSDRLWSLHFAHVSNNVSSAGFYLLAKQSCSPWLLPKRSLFFVTSKSSLTWLEIQYYCSLLTFAKLFSAMKERPAQCRALPVWLNSHRGKPVLIAVPESKYFWIRCC